MSERRNQLIGARFTRKEKNFIENYIKSRNISLTEFLREAVFSHINNLKDNVGNIDVSEFLMIYYDMEKASKVILNNIKSLRESIDTYGLKKLDMEFKNQKSKEIEPT